MCALYSYLCPKINKLIWSVIIRRVSVYVAGFQSEKYRVETEIFQGPLDLLLQLIERAELDITTLALSQVTDQYLAYLKNIKEQNATEVSAFLVIAARLLQIKSAALLPRPPLIERLSEGDPGEELARQLIQYRRFKQISQEFINREEKGLQTYLRISPPAIKVEGKLDLSGFNIGDLILSARQVFHKEIQLEALSKVVSLPRITIREKLQVIISKLQQNGRVNFKSILSTRSKMEIVVAFLAMLELIKRHLIQVDQPQIFGDINMEGEGEITDKVDVDSEFGE